MVTMTSAYSAYSVVESNDSSSPLLTHFSILFLLLVHSVTLRATSISMGHKTTLASNPSPHSFPQCFQLSKTSQLGLRKWKVGKEKSQALPSTSKHCQVDHEFTVWIPHCSSNSHMLCSADTATNRADLQRFWSCLSAPRHRRCLMGTHRHPHCSSRNSLVLPASSFTWGQMCFKRLLQTHASNAAFPNQFLRL